MAEEPPGEKYNLHHIQDRQIDGSKDGTWGRGWELSSRSDAAERYGKIPEEELSKRFGPGSKACVSVERIQQPCCVGPSTLHKYNTEERTVPLYLPGRYG